MKTKFATLLLAIAAIAAVGNGELEWDPPVWHGQIDEYFLVYGGEPRTYTNAIRVPIIPPAVAPATKVALTNMGAGDFYFSAVTHSADGVWSDYGNEIFVSIPPPPLRLRFTPGVPVTLQFVLEPDE